MNILVRAGKDVGGAVFEKRAFNLLVDGREIAYNGSDNRSHFAKVHIAQGIDTHKMDKAQCEEFLGYIVDELIDQHKSRARETPLVQTIESSFHSAVGVWSDIMPREQAFANMDYRFKVNKRDRHSSWIGDEEDSWGKDNIGIVQTYFKEGTMHRSHCILLGLPKKWAAPDQRMDRGFF
jgi:hypothetical protein